MTAWRELLEGKPGSRFQNLHEHRRKAPDGARSVGILAGGIVVCIAGLLLVLTPGPGVAVLLLGAALIAVGSFTAARFLDHAELALRRFARRLLGRRPG